MRTVAVISQTFRANYCHSYLNGNGDASVILTSDPTAFDDYEFSPPVRVVAVSPPPQLLPSRRLARGRLFRSILNRARAGSKLGRWLERTIKRFVWRLRYVDRMAILVRRKRPQTMDADSVRSSAIYAQLLAEHEEQQIDRVVVFDVFDLPVALQFGEDHELEVLVR